MSALTKIVRPDVKQLSPYNAGLSIEEVQKKYNVTHIAKLGSNENPFGPAPEVLNILKQLSNSVFLYPQPDGGPLRDALGDYLNADADCLVFGNGSEELISIICRTVVGADDKIITLYPSFPLHEDYPRMMGGHIERIPITQSLEVDLDALLEAASKPAKMVMFANPMNPVGAGLTAKQIRKLIQNIHPETLLVLDEAYYEYAINDPEYKGGPQLLADCENDWIVLRTFSKAWGLAGLRLGYGICSSKELRQSLDLTRTPFNTNALAQLAALEALKYSDHMKLHAQNICAAREQTKAELAKIGYRCAPSLGNFLFFNVHENAAQLAERLLKSGTILKPWKQDGFDHFVRVSIGKDEDNQHLINDLSQIRSIA